ncbi:MAG: ribonuclease III [Bernardetiaceae bacterium]
MRWIRWLISRFRRYSAYEKKLSQAVGRIVGAKPINIALYSLAMRHTSAARKLDNGYMESNERLEYLGDAILDAVVADFLFKKFPYKDEGFLTDIRSRIVSRDSLNQLARKLGLDELVQYEQRNNPRMYKSMLGDAMEAFVGAIYLDRGYPFTRRFIIQKLILTYLDIDQIVATDPNYKSQLIEWGQSQGKRVQFKIIEDKNSGRDRQFRVHVQLNGETLAKGTGFSKKKAEQDAARKALDALQEDEPDS